ncbi:MAG: glycosyltransferase family 2 protein [Coriobacteriia bacterium]
MNCTSSTAGWSGRPANHPERRRCPRGLTTPRVSLVIPALNEAESLQQVFSRLPDALHEVIVVDGHSTDGTIETAKRLLPDAVIVRQDGAGKGNALRCGFAAASGDAIVAIDADGSTDPAEIPAFVGALQAGAEYVKGSRFLPGAGTNDMTLVRKFGNGGFVLLARLMYGVRYSDFTYGYTAFWRRCLPALDLRSNGFEIECEMTLRAVQSGLKIVEVACFEQPRYAGEAHLRPFPDGWRILKQMFRTWRD